MAASAYDAPATAQLANASASVSFVLTGGIYVLAAIATWGGGNVELQKLGPDGVTYLSFNTAAKLTANGMTAPIYVPPGQYRLTVTTATGVYTDLSRVPIA